MKLRRHKYRACEAIYSSVAMNPILNIRRPTHIYDDGLSVAGRESLGIGVPAQYGCYLDREINEIESFEPEALNSPYLRWSFSPDKAVSEITGMYRVS